MKLVLADALELTPIPFHGLGFELGQEKRGLASSPAHSAGHACPTRCDHSSADRSWTKLPWLRRDFSSRRPLVGRTPWFLARLTRDRSCLEERQQIPVDHDMTGGTSFQRRPAVHSSAREFEATPAVFAELGPSGLSAPHPGHFIQGLRRVGG
jgi:hypothetical protein